MHRLNKQAHHITNSVFRRVGRCSLLPLLTQLVVLTTCLPHARAEDPFPDLAIPPGNLLWVKSIQAPLTGYEHIAVSTFGDSSSIVAGFFAGTTTFKQGVSLQASDSDDIFIARYSKSGQLQWAKQAGGTSQEGALSVASLADGSSVITGFIQEDALFEGVTLSSQQGSRDIFIARYDPDGNLLWAKSIGGPSDDVGTYVSVFPDEQTLILVGAFQGNVTFGTGMATTTLSSQGSSDIFIARYDLGGDLVWARRAGGGLTDVGVSTAVRTDGLSLVVTGHFQGTATFGTGLTAQTLIGHAESSDMFIASYDFDGTLQWARSAGGGSIDAGTSVSVSTDGSSFVTGHFKETATFSPGVALTTPSERFFDVFIARYDSGGTLLWAERAGGLSNDYGFSLSVGLDSVWLTGSYRDVATFGTGTTAETTLSSQGINDIYIARYDLAGNFVWAKSAGGAGIDGASSISAIGSNAVLTGACHETATFTSPQKTIGMGLFVAKYKL